MSLTITAAGALSGIIGSEKIPMMQGSTKGYGTPALLAAKIGAVINASMAPYSATGNGSTDDLSAIQAAIDAANTAGGGIVYLPPGTYKISNTIQMYSNVTLCGAGAASIIRPVAGALAGKSISSITVYASIAMTGITAATVRDLKLDHRTNSTDTNGITIGGHGAATRSTNCLVENVRIDGYNSHQYLVWIANADYNIVRGCKIVGHSTTTSTDLAGVEVYGGTGNQVLDNDVSYCGPGVAVIQEAATSGSDLKDTRVIGNRVDHCYNGIQVTNTNSRTHVDTIISFNAIATCTNRGINLSVSASGTMRNVVIASNTIDATATGIALDANGATPTATTAISVAGNVISGGTGGMNINGVSGASISGNVVSAVSGSAITAQNLTSGSFTGNTISAPTGVGIDAYTISGVTFSENSFWQLPGAALSFSDSGSSACIFRNNNVDRTVGNASNVVSGSTATSIRCFSNQIVNLNGYQAYLLGTSGYSDAAVNYSVGSTTPINALSAAGTFVRMNGGSVDVTLNGIAGGKDGDMKYLFNNNGTYSITLAANSGSAATGDKLGLGASSTVVVAAGKTAVLRFSILDNKWMIVSVY